MPNAPLADAAKLLALMFKDDLADAELCERSAPRSVNRFTSEIRGVNLQHLGVAVQALDVPDEDPQALTVLLKLHER